MNQQPHTHKVTIRGRYGEGPTLVLDYGDQQTAVWTKIGFIPVPGWRSRLERKTKRLIKRHDKQSMKAHLQPTAVASTVASKHNKVLLERKNGYYADEPIQGVWGSDLISIPKQAEPA